MGVILESAPPATCAFCLRLVDESPRVIFPGLEIFHFHGDCAKSFGVAILGDYRE